MSLTYEKITILSELICISGSSTFPYKKQEQRMFNESSKIKITSIQTLMLEIKSVVSKKVELKLRNVSELLTLLTLLA